MIISKIETVDFFSFVLSLDVWPWNTFFAFEWLRNEMVVSKYLQNHYQILWTLKECTTSRLEILVLNLGNNILETAHLLLNINDQVLQNKKYIKTIKSPSIFLTLINLFIKVSQIWILFDLVFVPRLPRISSTCQNTWLKFNDCTLSGSSNCTHVSWTDWNLKSFIILEKSCESNYELITQIIHPILSLPAEKDLLLFFYLSLPLNKLKFLQKEKVTPWLRGLSCHLSPSLGVISSEYKIDER